MPALIPITVQAAPMASAPSTPAPPTLSLDDENTIQHFKQRHERSKRQKYEQTIITGQRKCKKCSLPSLEANYGFCGTHRAKGIHFL